MPQLDSVIFKYENINFIISFFFLFFLNQYYVFPTLLRNITVRRFLITRKIDSTDNIFFSIVFLKRFRFVQIDNIFFNVNVNGLNNLIMSFYKIVLGLQLGFNFFKGSLYNYYLNLYRLKLMCLIWVLVN